ncbi:penicillin-binding protein 1A [Reinekea marinisedimentorum]|uniref:Penicillin-binding protein 1A n=1 Tax=Reinekea marinisedimentorum TaxID=230495 RepID=A0A4R3I0N1_9GAMM|nr:penicillin-binding protein 1A [Reinekea marinisedimentorum]TCS38221.1 penicillin-binding protein 1A [Reinekea marinisedimentorum]
MKLVIRSIHFLLWLGFLAICGSVLISASVYLYLSPHLPDVVTLKDFKLQTPMRILSSDNKLIAEYGEIRRTPLTFDQVPVPFVQALIAIEDKRFEEHHGVDPIRFTRVTLDVLITGDKEGAGGSTLTQQVARNYFLTQQKTFTRKFTEILLALKMEQELTKAEIFELYINKHFLGYRSYGIQAAATVYYGKDINDLSLAQLAMIAGLHQLPSGANPISYPDRALRRRNTVLDAMLANAYITESEHSLAVAEPIDASYHGNNPDFEAYYLAEMVRAEMLERFGEAAYTDGYSIYTTVNSDLQVAANRGVRKTLLSYSRRHGYSGREEHFNPEGADGREIFKNRLERLNKTPVFGDLIPALVVPGDESTLSFIPKGDDKVYSLTLEEISWARKRISVNERGPEITSSYQVAVPGDLIRLEKTATGWALAQVPEAQGALVALSPTDGSIQAMVGGFDFILNKYNRAVQSSRQPGSNFKPFIYSAAIDAGYTPASIVNDAPIVRADASLEDVWRPKNSGDRYLGPIPMRQALYQSRNLSSIRILDSIGIRYARNYAERFGFKAEELANDMTLVLGSTAMSPLKVATGYAVFANGGYQVEPYFIQRIEDKSGNILFEATPKTVCRGCPEAPSYLEGETDPANENAVAIDITPLALAVDQEASQATAGSTAKKSYAPQVLSPQTAFLMNSMLQDVIQKGTGRAARSELNRSDLAGKTGTTNDAVDAWFTGYNGDYVATAWVGYDSNTSLGNNEFGGKAALPAWLEFMKTALENKPLNSQPQPVGIVQVRIDPATGLLARPGSSGARFEFFKENNVPTEYSNSALTIDFSAEQTLPQTENGAPPASAPVESLF